MEGNTYSPDDIYIEPGHDFSHLQNKLLYYPVAGKDFLEPILAFRNIVSEFWFVDIDYYRDEIPEEPLNIEGLSYLRTVVSFCETTREREFKYVEPYMQKDIYEYNDREIAIVRRRGFDYNSLFGPSTLETAEKRLGIFFYRGDSFEGGSNHPWMSNHPVKMIRGASRVQLLDKVLETLPDGGLLVTDGSNHKMINCSPINDEYSNLYRFYKVEYNPQKDIPSNQAMELAERFQDSKGNRFSCIGYVGYKYGPTLIWKINKAGNQIE